MRKSFFSRFEAQEKTVHKSISLGESEWRLIEAYKLYGISQAGHDIPVQRLLREIILSHVQRDRSFMGAHEDWLGRLAEVEAAAAADGLVS